MSYNIETTSELFTIYLVVPQYPDLTLVCMAPDQYPPELLHQLQQHLMQWQPKQVIPQASPQFDISVPCIRALLRSLHDPQQIARNPLAVHYIDIPAAERGVYIVQCLMTAINVLEQPVPDAEPDMRGTLLRMRYIERRKTRTLLQLLHLSERHYYRLHASGLEWLAAHLASHLNVQEREWG